MRDAHYDVAVDLQGAMRSAVLARLSGARVVYGAAEPRESPASLWYTRKVVAHGRHVVEQNLSVAQALFEQTRRDVCRRIFLATFLAIRRLRRVSGSGLRNYGLGDFAILNPGAGWGAKRWPAERYGEVARELADAGCARFSTTVRAKKNW